MKYMPDSTVCNILFEATSYSMVQQIINTVLFGVFGFRFGGLVLWVIWLVGCFFSKVRFDYFLKITDSEYFWSSMLWHVYMSVYGVCKGGSLSMGSVSRSRVGMMFVRPALLLACFQQPLLRWREICVELSKAGCAVSSPRDSSTLDPVESMDTTEEQRVHSPPASLVPRIHVILAQKLQHINPLLPACLNEEESKTCEYPKFTSLCEHE